MAIFRHNIRIPRAIAQPETEDDPSMTATPPVQAAPSEGPSWLRNPDPLGISLRSRANESRMAGNPTGLGQTGPLRDPMWDAFFQATKDNGVDDMAEGEIAARGSGRSGAFWRDYEMAGEGPSSSTFDPRAQSSAALQSGRSRQINSATNPALAGILAAVGRRSR